MVRFSAVLLSFFEDSLIESLCIIDKNKQSLQKHAEIVFKEFI